MGGGCRKIFIIRTGGRGLQEDFCEEGWWEGIVIILL